MFQEISEIVYSVMCDFSGVGKEGEIEENS